MIAGHYICKVREKSSTVLCLSRSQCVIERVFIAAEPRLPPRYDQMLPVCERGQANGPVQMGEQLDMRALPSFARVRDGGVINRVKGVQLLPGHHGMVKDAAAVRQYIENKLLVPSAKRGLARGQRPLLQLLCHELFDKEHMYVRRAGADFCRMIGGYACLMIGWDKHTQPVWEYVHRLVAAVFDGVPQKALEVDPGERHEKRYVLHWMCRGHCVHPHHHDKKRVWDHHDKKRKRVKCRQRPYKQRGLHSEEVIPRAEELPVVPIAHAHPPSQGIRNRVREVLVAPEGVLGRTRAAHRAAEQAVDG
jgi:hypothetical protein